jgi:hypothetical protein
VIVGAVAETKELGGGYWLWQVAWVQVAIVMVKGFPNPLPGDLEIEIRKIYEAEDFGDALTPELREKEERLRAQTEKSTPRTTP